MFQKRRLDAVYYYMRSLAASNPFITARESLMSLFDDAKKKVSERNADIRFSDQIRIAHLIFKAAHLVTQSLSKLLFILRWVVAWTYHTEVLK